MLNPATVLHTGRLILRPVGWADLPELIALKGDPRVFSQMLGGVRSPVQVQQELSSELVCWSVNRFGLWTIREGALFQGITGLHHRPDGRGVALRLAFWPEARGRGIAREACGIVLRYAHDELGLSRIVAVTREDNFGSRIVLGGIGMTCHAWFERDGYRMVIYESRCGVDIGVG